MLTLQAPDADILTAGYTIRKRNLVGYWNFNLQTLADSSGNGTTLTKVGGSYTATGASGYGLAFSGDNDYLTL